MSALGQSNTKLAHQLFVDAVSPSMPIGGGVGGGVGGCEEQSPLSLTLQQQQDRLGLQINGTIPDQYAMDLSASPADQRTIVMSNNGNGNGPGGAINFKKQTAAAYALQQLNNGLKSNSVGKFCLTFFSPFSSRVCPKSIFI